MLRNWLGSDEEHSLEATPTWNLTVVQRFEAPLRRQFRIFHVHTALGAAVRAGLSGHSSSLPNLSSRGKNLGEGDADLFLRGSDQLWKVRHLILAHVHCIKPWHLSDPVD